MKKISAILIVFLLLTSCVSCKKMVSNWDSEMNEDKSLEAILDALETDDEEKIKSMFSKESLAKATDFDKYLNLMFDFFDGNVQSWKQKGSSVFESKDRGHITKEAYVWYQVDTEYNSYLFIIIECLMDTKNPDNMGLYTLRIIHTQDADTLFTSWDDVKIPGIYIPKTGDGSLSL